MSCGGEDLAGCTRTVLVPVQPPRRTLPALETRTVHATLVQAEFALNFDSRTKIITLSFLSLHGGSGSSTD